MPEMTKPLFISLLVNLFLVIGGYGLFDAGVVGEFVDISNTDEITYYDSNATIEGASEKFSSTVPNEDSFFSDIPGGQQLSQFFDALGVVKDFITFVANIAVAPIALMAEGSMPNIVRVLVGVPLLFFNVFGVVSFIRSGS
jgi:hypothetical protein